MKTPRTFDSVFKNILLQQGGVTYLNECFGTEVFDTPEMYLSSIMLFLDTTDVIDQETKEIDLSSNEYFSYFYENPYFIEYCVVEILQIHKDTGRYIFELPKSWIQIIKDI